MQVRLQGIRFEIDDELQKYVDKKLAGLEKYLPRTARGSAVMEVRFKNVKKQQTCEVVLTLPKDRFVVDETTVNVYAAIDIVEDALKQHITRYKQRHASGQLYHRLRLRMRRV